MKEHLHPVSKLDSRQADARDSVAAIVADLGMMRSGQRILEKRTTDNVWALNNGRYGGFALSSVYSHIRGVGARAVIEGRVICKSLARLEHLRFRSSSINSGVLVDVGDADAEVVFLGCHFELGTDLAVSFVNVTAGARVAFVDCSFTGGDGSTAVITNPGDAINVYVSHSYKDTDAPWGRVSTSRVPVYEVTRIVAGDSPYDILVTDTVLMCDTDAGKLTVRLPAGRLGTHYRVTNTGTSGNDVTLSPDGAELLVGLNASMNLIDGETLNFYYETTEGWW